MVRAVTGQQLNFCSARINDRAEFGQPGKTRGNPIGESGFGEFAPQMRRSKRFLLENFTS